jgi:hypothetical protein
MSSAATASAPARESFFKILNDLRVLFGVPRPRADMRARPNQGTSGPRCLSG